MGQMVSGFQTGREKVVCTKYGGKRKKKNQSLEFILSVLSGTQCFSFFVTFSECVFASHLGLPVYSTNFLILSACTKVGCTNSSQVAALTSQLPPGPLLAPSLTLLDSQTILVE